MKLIAEASFIHHHNSITPRLLTFLGAPSQLYRLMIVPLIPPGVIDADAKLVVKMAVALDTKYGQGESDPLSLFLIVIASLVCVQMIN